MNYEQPSSWHEAANLFPLFEANDLAELAQDISENGLLNPVILYEGKVLDGRNRLLACKEAGVKPAFVEWLANGVSPVAWVISQNLKRRHLISGQRAAVAVEAKVLLAAEAKRRQQEAGKEHGRGQIGSIKNDISYSNPSVQKEVAKQFDVSEGYVHAAQKIKDADDKVFQRVKAGTISIPEAQKELGFKQSTKAMVASDSNEWYTPENYVKTVKEVLGTIDLDPASCELANKFIKAGKFFTQEDDGLRHKWFGSVFLNPPYGDLGPKFVAKLLEEYEAGHVKEAILLVNSHCTDSKWFKPLFDYVLCFTDHRSRFWNADGVGTGPTHGSVFVYLGLKPDVFAARFKQYGAIVQTYQEDTTV